MNELPGHTYNTKVLCRVYVGLLLLAALMITLAKLPFERIPVGDFADMHTLKMLLVFGVALCMAVLISGFLMGLRYEKTLTNGLIFGSCFAFLLIFVLFTWADYAYRGLMDPSFSKQINWDSPVTKENAREAAESHAP